MEGVEAIRAAIKDAGDQVHFVVDPRCRQLIEALRCYHYPQDVVQKEKELPVKDGVYDHPIDALRYFFVNHLGVKGKIRRC
jgi:phage terminase large subunit